MAQGSGERKTEVLHPQPSQHAPPTRSGAAACKESAVVNGHTRTCLANCLNRAARIDRTQSIFIPCPESHAACRQRRGPLRMSSLQLDKRVTLGQRTVLRGLQGLLPVCSCSLLSASSTRSHGPMQSFSEFVGTLPTCCSLRCKRLDFIITATPHAQRQRQVLCLSLHSPRAAWTDHGGSHRPAPHAAKRCRDAVAFGCRSATSCKP